MVRVPRSVPHIARGAALQAEGTALLIGVDSTSPLKMSPKKSIDILGSHLKGPWLSLTAAELAIVGCCQAGHATSQRAKMTDSPPLQPGHCDRCDQNCRAAVRKLK